MERIDDLNLNGKKVVQDTDLFLFGMDSVLLANMVKNLDSQKVLVDLGTGCAVMPIIICEKNNFNKIIGVEIQDKMYNLAIKNIKLNNLEDKIYILKEDLKNIEKLKENICEITGKEKVDIVISNPPYKKEGTGSKNKEDEKYIARHEVKCNLEDLFKTVESILKIKGKFYLVHKPERIADLISIGRKYNLEAKKIRFMQPTINKKPSIVLVEYVLGGGNECIVENVLIEFDENNKYSKEILDIYNM